LGFSEHLLLSAALTLPLQAFQLGPVLAHNAAILLSLALAGWGMALLVRRWSHHQGAALLAGLIFAFVPARLKQWSHLHELSIQWLPFMILALELWLSRRRWRDLILFTLFLNLQLLSAINYVPQTIILVGLYLLFALLRQPGHFISRPILGGGGLALLLTLLLNWPVISVYFEISALHQFERGLGDAAIYGAALVDFLTPPPENVLYGDWLTPRLADPARPLIPLFPGLVPALLGSIALLGMGRQSRERRQLSFFLLGLIVVAVLLSFGANEQAFGPALAGPARLFLPYRWLFEVIPGLSGLRVPARMVILAFFGLAALAGLGATRLAQSWSRPGLGLTLAGLLIFLEYLPVPLPGREVPVEANFPPVYAALAADPAEKVVLELPYDLERGGINESIRLYYSSPAWYRLVNGASGFNPAGLQDLSATMQRFPDNGSFEVIRRLGVSHLVLHAAEFGPDRWHDIWSKLPAYWPSVPSVAQFGDDYLLALRPAACPAQPEAVLLSPGQTDGQLSLNLTNNGSVSFIIPPQPARLELAGAGRRVFAPLFIPPGESRTLSRLLPLPADFSGPLHMELPGLFQGDLALGETAGHLPAGPALAPPGVGLEIGFGDNLALAGYTLQPPASRPCQVVTLRLYWSPAESLAQRPARATVRLVDRFGQTVTASSVALPGEAPRLEQGALIVDHRLPLLETMPAGQYGLALSLAPLDGPAYSPSNTGARLVVGSEVLLSELLVRPEPPPVAFAEPALGHFENGLHLLAAEVDHTGLKPGDWLRLTLYWRADQAVSQPLTVFTQLVGPDGQVWGQYDNPPRAGWYPTPLWSPGEIVSDDYLIRLDPAAPPGQFQLATGFYHPDTLSRLPVVDEAGRVTGDALTATVLVVRSE
jgi:hypothetical protein